MIFGLLRISQDSSSSFSIWSVSIRSFQCLSHYIKSSMFLVMIFDVLLISGVPVNPQWFSCSFFQTDSWSINYFFLRKSSYLYHVDFVLRCFAISFVPSDNKGFSYNSLISLSYHCFLNEINFICEWKCFSINLSSIFHPYQSPFPLHL